jgi:hypothetical protein
MQKPCLFTQALADIYPERTLAEKDFTEMDREFAIHRVIRKAGNE